MRIARQSHLASVIILAERLQSQLAFGEQVTAVAKLWQNYSVQLGLTGVSSASDSSVSD
jgi:hypothetical protein